MRPIVTFLGMKSSEEFRKLYIAQVSKNLHEPISQSAFSMQLLSAASPVCVSGRCAAAWIPPSAKSSEDRHLRDVVSLGAVRVFNSKFVFNSNNIVTS